MVELKKKASAAVTPINPGAIVSGLIGVTILNGNQPYPDQTITPSMMTISATEA